MGVRDGPRWFARIRREAAARQAPAATLGEAAGRRRVAGNAGPVHHLARHAASIDATGR
jgi:hypothetical protein